MFTYEETAPRCFTVYQNGKSVGDFHCEAVAEQFCRHLNERDKAQAEFAEWWRAAS